MSFLIYAVLVLVVMTLSLAAILGLLTGHWKSHIRCLSCNKGIIRDQITHRDRFGANVPICPHCGESRPGAVSFDQVGRWAYGRWQWKDDPKMGTFRMELNGQEVDVHAVYAHSDGKLIAVRYGSFTKEWILTPGAITHHPEPLEALAALSKTA